MRHIGVPSDPQERQLAQKWELAIQSHIKGNSSAWSTACRVRRGTVHGTHGRRSAAPPHGPPPEVNFHEYRPLNPGPNSQWKGKLAIDLCQKVPDGDVGNTLQMKFK